jgi:hypothetical protein
MPFRDQEPGPLGREGFASLSLDEMTERLRAEFERTMDGEPVWRLLALAARIHDGQARNLPPKVAERAAWLIEEAVARRVEEER